MSQNMSQKCYNTGHKSVTKQVMKGLIGSNERIEIPRGIERIDRLGNGVVMKGLKSKEVLKGIIGWIISIPGGFERNEILRTNERNESLSKLSTL